MKTILRFIPKGKIDAKIVKTFTKKSIKVPKSKIQIIPAQKAPKIKSLTDKEIKLRQTKIAEQDIRNTVGGEDFPNFSHRSLESLRAESIGNKISVRRFDRSLKKALKQTRTITATGIKGRKLKVKTPTAPSIQQKKAGIFKGSGLPKSKPVLKLAKSKGAMKAYKIADTRAENIFKRTMDRFTSKTKASPFAMRTAKVKKSPMEQSIAKQMGLDDREYFNPKSGKTFINTVKFGDRFKKK